MLLWDSLLGPFMEQFVASLWDQFWYRSWEHFLKLLWGHFCNSFGGHFEYHFWDMYASLLIILGNFKYYCGVILEGILGVILAVILGGIFLIIVVPFRGQVKTTVGYHFESYFGIVVGSLFAHRPTTTLIKTMYFREHLRNTYQKQRF